jgi:hypothetical protein
MAAYDWRLSYYNLEVRDGYFSRYVFYKPTRSILILCVYRLKAQVETFKYVSR